MAARHRATGGGRPERTGGTGKPRHGRGTRRAFIGRAGRSAREDRFIPDLDPYFGDEALGDVRHDIAIGRWQGVRDLLRDTGDDWPRRTHRIRLLAHIAAGTSAVESWRAAEPDNPDAAVLRAATEVVRVFDAAIAAGRGART
ncbi:hypothetical protein ACISUF_10745, partial [Streptomyces sp. NPDC003090]